MNEDPRPPQAKPCPICGKPRDPRYAPFCSARCADIDLGRWLKGSYVIPGRSASEDGEEDEPSVGSPETFDS
jgi:endogenous inhibitor of DNA gyrase (YacG/DUF329 family)